MNDGGDATLLTHKGTELEADWAKDGSLPDPANTTNPEFNCILQLTKDSFYPHGCHQADEHGEAVQGVW